MDKLARFLEYAAAFDVAAETGDWTGVEDSFVEAAVFESRAEAPMDAYADGRVEILRHFQTTMALFDDRFDSRGMRFLAGPALKDGVIAAEFEATYAIKGAPDLVFKGKMHAEFEGDRMSLLRDEIDSEQASGVRDWLTAHGALLGEAET